MVLHHVRGVRGAVPGRHRARRPHRGHAPPPGADRVGVPLRARGAVPQPGEQGQPVGAERPQPHGLDEEARLRGADLRRGARARGGVPVLDRLRGRVRRRRAEDRAGHGRAAAPRRGQLRGAGPRGDLHRRPRPPLGQRVPVPDARPAERRSAQQRVRGPRAGHPQDRHDVPALPQHAGPGVPAARRALRGRAPHPAAEQAGPRRQARPGRRAATTAAAVTYHDPCYLGRHNEIYEDPRALVGAAGAHLSEMPRHADRSMCCGAGGARMWMEERIGQRVNVNRTTEALDTLTDAGGEHGHDRGGLPVLPHDAHRRPHPGPRPRRGENVQVQDVSQMLLAAVAARVPVSRTRRRPRRRSAGWATPAGCGSDPPRIRRWWPTACAHASITMRLTSGSGAGFGRRPGSTGVGAPAGRRAKSVATTSSQVWPPTWLSQLRQRRPRLTTRHSGCGSGALELNDWRRAGRTFVRFSAISARTMSPPCAYSASAAGRPGRSRSRSRRRKPRTSPPRPRPGATTAAAAAPPPARRCSRRAPTPTGRCCTSARPRRRRRRRATPNRAAARPGAAAGAGSAHPARPATGSTTTPRTATAAARPTRWRAQRLLGACA